MVSGDTVMAEKEGVPAWLESARAFLNVARDGILLIVLLMLLLLPTKVNEVLTKAGFTSASIMGFEWQRKLEQATKETETAKDDVQRLNTELAAQTARMVEIADQVREPETRRKATELAQQIKASQSTADRIGKQLDRNLIVQREFQNELKRRSPNQGQ